MSEKKLRLGIIGFGNMGTSHAKNIADGKCPEIVLTAVADIKEARRDCCKELYPDVAVFDNAEAMMDSGLVDAVLVAVPHYDHPEYAKEGFKRGLHVMVEKPAGVYTRQVREMNEAAKSAGVTFGMMFNQRTTDMYRKMKEILDSGKLGEIRRVSWIITDWFRGQGYYDSGAWRATWSGEGGGVLLNQCPHQLDLLQWITGLPVKVQAHLHYGKWHDIEVEDDVTAYFEYANGATGTFITTAADYPGSNRFEVTCEKGKMVAENSKLTVWELDESIPDFSERTRTSGNSFGHPNATSYEAELDGQNTGHYGVLNAFAGNILHGTPLIAGGEEGIRGLTLSNAMHLSDWLGRAVEIPFDEDLYYEELMKRVKNSRRKENVNEVTADDMSSTYGTKNK